MRQKKYYEPISLTGSFATSALSAIFYYLNTRKAPDQDKVSGIIVNFFINVFMAKTSIDDEVGFLDDKYYFQAVLYPLFAALLSAPQTLITAFAADSDGAAIAVLASIATLSSNSVLYMHSLRGLTEFMHCNVVPQFRPATPENWQLRKNVVHNLDLLLERLRFCDYKGSNAASFDIIPQEGETDEDALFRLAYQLSLSAPHNEPQHHHTLASIATFPPKLALAILLVYGSLGYTCAVEAALIKYFLKESPDVAVALSMVLMGCQYILNIKAAFILASTIIDTIVGMIRYRKLPNDMQLGGTVLQIVTLLSPLFAGLMASYSGFTSRSLYSDNCPHSKLSFMRIPHGGDVIDGATRAFNGIYAAISMATGKEYYIEHADHLEKERGYLRITGSVAAFRSAIKSTPANQLGHFLAVKLNDENVQLLKDPDLFSFSRQDEHARLIP